MSTALIGSLPQEPENFSHCTLQEMLALQQETHAASQEVRMRIRLVVAKRLAKEITLAEFKAEHLAATQMQAIFHSRHNRLGLEIQQRRQEAKRNLI